MLISNLFSVIIKDISNLNPKIVIDVYLYY